MGIFQQIWQDYAASGDGAALQRAIAPLADQGADMQSFGEDMETALADRDALLQMLSVGVAAAENAAASDTPTSFLGMLLREDAVQPRVLDALLERLAECATGMDGEHAAQDATIARLVLREMRWIDHVVDARDLVEKLMSALPTFPMPLQRDVIYILPEIARDDDAHIVIDVLLELIRNEAELVVCCIEALGNFNVMTEQTSEVVQCVLDRLDAAPLADLPAIVKYLVQEAPGTDVAMLVDQLRDNLSSALAAFAAERSGATSTTSNEEALILSSITQAFHFRDALRKAFVTIIAAAGEQATPLRLLDVWIIIAMHSIPRDRLAMEKLFRKKISNGAITRALIVQSVQRHASALASYFPSLVALASAVLTPPIAPTALAMGGLLYELLFEEFSLQSPTQAALYQGEIVSSLLGHCLSANAEVAETALDTFMTLLSPQVSFKEELTTSSEYSQQVQFRHQRLDIFLPSLKQLLDAMVTSASPSHVRKIYGILFAVGGPEDAELCNTLRKQMFHQDMRYRQYGIIGAIIRLDQQLKEARQRYADNVDNQPVVNDAARVFNRSVVDLFEQCSTHGSSAAFMLSEMLAWVETLEHDRIADMVLDIIYEYFMEVLSQRFMDDYDQREAERGAYGKAILEGAIKTELWMSLDNERSPVYLRLLDLAASPNVADNDALVFLSPLVELVLSCARKKNQLGDINCVLVCPLLLMERSILEDLGAFDTHVRVAVCTALWHAVNWIRTILGFFASETEEYYVSKLTERLRNLCTIESALLEDAVGECHEFVPPSKNDSALTLVDLRPKRIGRPPKSAVAGGDLKSLVRASFVDLKPSVLRILAFPALLNIAARDVDQIELSEADETDASLILFLFRHLKGMSQLASKDSAVLDSKMLTACGQFARYYLQVNKRLCDQDDGNSTLAQTSKEIIVIYLIIGGRISEVKLRSTQIQRCVAFYLPAESQIDKEDPSDEHQNQAIESCFTAVLCFAETIGDSLSFAVVHLEALAALLSILYGFPAEQVLLRVSEFALDQEDATATADALATQLSKQAHELLQVDWSRGDRKFTYRASELEVLIRCYLLHGPGLLDRVQALAVEGFLQLVDSTEVPQWPTLTRKTLGVFYRVLFETLVTATSRVDVTRQAQSVALLLAFLTHSALLFKLLVAIPKSFPKSTVLGTVLKAGRRYIEAIMRVMPFLQQHFRTFPEEVMALIGEVQVATRRMQVLCAHGKLIKDQTASAQVPKVKQVLERFIYRGEELARAHGVLDAYTTGVLKNRRLDGTTISKDELDARDEDDASSDTESDECEETQVEERRRVSQPSGREETKTQEGGDEDEESEEEDEEETQTASESEEATQRTAKQRKL